jgi:hypothetical protein
MDDKSESTVHPDFQRTAETDVALRSTDHTLFYLEKDRLKYYCADGFPDASEISASFKKDPVLLDVVDMTDANAESLWLLLQYMFPREQPDISAVGLEIVLRAARETLRYQVHAALPSLKNGPGVCVVC